MKAVVAAFNQEKALVGAFSVITKLRMQFGCNFLKHPFIPSARSISVVAVVELQVAVVSVLAADRSVPQWWVIL